jgi:bis(5'-nucleosyl)-tetraphosphatase (symmetrical)
MSTWAIGDVQGCMSSLERLLDRLALTGADTLWLVGDLVNRGPRSLDVLRWARGRGAVCVLGNHDLHLLARVAGAAGAKKRDTLDDVLAAPDRDELVDWLRRRPFVQVGGPFALVTGGEPRAVAMVHGGLHPRWSIADARSYSDELSAQLAGPDWRDWLAEVGTGGGKVPRWKGSLRGADRGRALLSYFARARCLDDDGVPDADFDEHPRDAPAGVRPWFAFDDVAWADHTVVFGHWAMLGLTVGVRHVGLDSGCVWGGRLTAMRLEDGYVVQQEAVEKRAGS